MKLQNYADTAHNMTDAELYGFFSKDHFYQDTNLMVAVCQEVENREAALTGRKPARIEFKTFNNPKLMGGAMLDVISLSACFLDSKNKHRYTPESLLNTILHEGRHIWQQQVTRNPELHCPDELRIQFAINELAYVNTRTAIDLGMNPDVQGCIQYHLQENEMDARHYALKRMMQISQRYRKDFPFQLQISRDFGRETGIYKLVTEAMTEEQYQLLERKYMERYNLRRKQARAEGICYPDVPEGTRCFENIRVFRHVVHPLYQSILEMSPELRKNTDRQTMLLITLYSATREYILTGRTLESPMELLTLLKNYPIFKEYNLQQLPFSGEQKIGKIKM